MKRRPRLLSSNVTQDLNFGSKTYLVFYVNINSSKQTTEKYMFVLQTRWHRTRGYTGPNLVVIVELPFNFTHDRPHWLKRPFKIVFDWLYTNDRLYIVQINQTVHFHWPFTLETVHFHRVGPSNFWDVDKVDSRLNKLYQFHLVPKVKLFRKIRISIWNFNCFANSQKQFCLLYYIVSLLILHHALAGNQSSKIPNILKVHH